MFPTNYNTYINKKNTHKKYYTSKTMTNTMVHIYHPSSYDAISEASTDGDDNNILLNYAMLGKNKNIAKNKTKSSLCRNFS
jgi:hypothetical protein